MAAYLHADLEITDAALFEKYRALVPSIIAAHGGRYLVRGGRSKLLEGTPAPGRQVIVEFADMAALESFYQSPEYAPLIAMRQRAARGSVIAVEGV